MYWQHNDQKKKDKRTNNDLQNATQKTNDQATRSPLKTKGELSSCSTGVKVCVYEALYSWYMASQTLYGMISNRYSSLKIKLRIIVECVTISCSLLLWRNI